MVNRSSVGNILEIKPFSVTCAYNSSASTTVILSQIYTNVRYAMEGGYPSDVTAVGISNISGNRITITSRNFYSATMTATGNILVFEV